MACEPAYNADGSGSNPGEAALSRRSAQSDRLNESQPSISTSVRAPVCPHHRVRSILLPLLLSSPLSSRRSSQLPSTSATASATSDAVSSTSATTSSTSASSSTAAATSPSDPSCWLRRARRVVPTADGKCLDEAAEGGDNNGCDREAVSTSSSNISSTTTNSNVVRSANTRSSSIADGNSAPGGRRRSSSRARREGGESRRSRGLSIGSSRYYSIGSDVHGDVVAAADVAETNDASAENGDDEDDDALFYDADADVDDSDQDGNDDGAGCGDGADDGADADADVSNYDGEIDGLVGSGSAAEGGDCSSERSNSFQSGHNSKHHSAAAAAAAATAAAAADATSSAIHWPCLAAAGNLPSIRLGEVHESGAIDSASIQPDMSIESASAVACKGACARVCLPAVVPWPFLGGEGDVGVHWTEDGLSHSRGHEASGLDTVSYVAMRNDEQQHEGKDGSGVDAVRGDAMGVDAMQGGGIPHRPHHGYHHGPHHMQEPCHAGCIPPGEGPAMDDNDDAMDGSTGQTNHGATLTELEPEPKAEFHHQQQAQPEPHAEPGTEPGPGPKSEPGLEPGVKFLGQDSPGPEAEAVPGLFANLPDDVGLDILSRLPWLNLASGRSVCRAWERDLAGEEVRELRKRSKRFDEWVFMVVPWNGDDGVGAGDGSVEGRGRSGAEGRRGSGEGRGRVMAERETGRESRGRSEERRERNSFGSSNRRERSRESIHVVSRSSSGIISRVSRWSDNSSSMATASRSRVACGGSVGDRNPRGSCVRSSSGSTSGLSRGGEEGRSRSNWGGTGKSKGRGEECGVGRSRSRSANRDEIGGSGTGSSSSSSSRGGGEGRMGERGGKGKEAVESSERVSGLIREGGWGWSREEKGKGKGKGKGSVSTDSPPVSTDSPPVSTSRGLQFSLNTRFSLPTLSISDLGVPPSSSPSTSSHPSTSSSHSTSSAPSVPHLPRNTSSIPRASSAVFSSASAGAAAASAAGAAAAARSRKNSAAARSSIKKPPLSSSSRCTSGSGPAP
ncbi:unnamed protein product [Closterium sp. NIES-53]